MRRAIPLLAAFTALAAALPAGAQPRVRAGTIPLLTPAASRVRVIVALRLPPLTLAGGRSVAAATVRRKLDVHDASARAYVAREERAQARAVAELHAEIPQARVGRRFQVLLDGLTVSLPDRLLPRLLGERWAAHVYPSLEYTMADDTSPSVIGADVLQRTTGASGAGIKIAIVDDGIDQTNPFFDPSGYSYPPGFPKGITSATTPKVIVARVFPGPGAGKAGALPVDPASSFHGTHVAGIAAGDSGTTAPAGADHPLVTGLTGVAPRAWLGNYRVFTVPTPIGHVANTPEVVAAFEAAVKDGMDVINFSGGGPEVPPQSDALIAAVHAATAAGVVTVVAAGNDHDNFGNGTVGSPATAPDAIAVAAVTNTHVFAPALDVAAAGAPVDLRGIPFVGANGERAPAAWSFGETLVDVGSIVGAGGKPVDRHACGTLPHGSLAGDVALVERGLCPFVEKAEHVRAAGAIGIVFYENRPGQPNEVPTQLPLPGGTIEDLDGEHLISYMSAHDGRTLVRVGRDVQELEDGRSGVVTSFSSSGPTDFGHFLKPDVSAPGGQVLSSTLPSIDPSRFAVFDGTSMATPHVSGAAALLLQLHRAWTPAQVKSALVSTAGPAWGDTARTREAAVPLEGGGLVSLPAAADPQIFTDPVSLSFQDLAPGASRTLLVQLSDAGDGAGTWNAELDAQSATPGTSVDVGAPGILAPGGTAQLAVTVHVAATAPTGEDYGFVVLQKGAVTRRIPYLFLADRPALASVPVRRLKTLQSGTTISGADRVRAYRYPDAPFGYQPDAPEMIESGAETVYETTLAKQAVNAGVAVWRKTGGAQIDPWFLGRRDENTVQGYAGTPVDVNELTYDYQEAIGVAGLALPQPGTYDVSVDSGTARFTGKRLAGRYVLHAWVNDVTPPTLQLLTTRVSTGRPTLVFRSVDTQSGVDPASLTLGWNGTLVAVGTYDRATGLAVFPLPSSVPALAAGTTRLRMMSSDYQESKNVDTSGPSTMPNTRTAGAALRVVDGVAVNWLLPAGGRCVARRTQLEVEAGSPAAVRSVRFSVDGRRAALLRSGRRGLWASVVRLRPGRHAVGATAVDAKGRSASVRRIVRVCG